MHHAFCSQPSDFSFSFVLLLQLTPNTCLPGSPHDSQVARRDASRRRLSQEDSPELLLDAGDFPAADGLLALEHLGLHLVKAKVQPGAVPL